jgi:glycosyltransferase involved in cell wall biosynthesis
VHDPLDPISTLQIGMGWHPEQPGKGLDRVYYALARHLPEVAVQVHGVVMATDPHLNRAGARIHRAAPASAPLIRRLKGVRDATHCLLRDAEPQVAAAHFALYAAPTLDRLAHLPFVMHFHGPWADESAAENEVAWKVWVKSRLERWVYQHADLFIVLSSAFRHVLTGRYGVPDERIRIVPGGVDVSRFDTGLTRRAARERLGWPVDRPILLSVRRLVRRVGLDRLIAALDRVRTHVPDVMLYIAGTGPLHDKLTRQIQELNMTDHAQLLGFVPDEDLPTAYRAADLSVVPTVAHEGFGLIVVESLASGTPVIVTPVGGLPEIITPLAEHLVLPDRQPATLADHLRRALTGRISLPSAEACQTYAASRYDWTSIAKQVRDVYEEVI